MSQGSVPNFWRRVICDSRTYEQCRPIVFGHPRILERALNQRDHQESIRVITSLDQIADSSERIICFQCGPDAAADVSPGIVAPEAGQAAHDYLVAGDRSGSVGQVDGIVTAPLNKAALHSAGIHYPGHTEILPSDVVFPITP